MPTDLEQLSFAELVQRFGDYLEQWENGVGGAGSGAYIRYTFNTADSGNSLFHLDIPAGFVLRTSYFGPIHEAQPGRNGAGGGAWKSIGGTPGVLGSIAYDATAKRIIGHGLFTRWEFIPDAGGLHMAQIGLIASDESNSLNQEARFTTAADYVLNQHTLQGDNGLVGMPLDGDGILWTDKGRIDLKLASWNAGERFKFFAKNGLLESGINLPVPIVRHGRGTSPQNRFTLPSDVDLYAEGNQDFVLANTSTRVIGNEIYESPSSVSYYRLRGNRCWIGNRVTGNTEKTTIEASGHYNDILFDYAPDLWNLAAYTGPVDKKLLTYWLQADDKPTERGELGEWNPVLNQQGVASNGVHCLTFDVETQTNGSATKALIGAFYRIKTGNDPYADVPAIDGITRFYNNRWLISDGNRWYQVESQNNTPDSNDIELTGASNQMGFRMAYNGDSSANVQINHESAVYRNVRMYPPYRGHARDLLEVHEPFILDRSGKHMFYGGWARGGDRMLFGFTGKDHGTDTTGFALRTNHVYGEMWHIDMATRVYGYMYLQDCGNGRKPGNSNIPTPAFRLNEVLDASGLEIMISKCHNVGIGEDGNYVAGAVIGDPNRTYRNGGTGTKFSKNLRLPNLSVLMGNPQLEYPDPLLNNYTAIQIRGIDGGHITSHKLAGKLDYWEDAQRLVHDIPSEWVLLGAKAQCHANADVTLVIKGDIAFDDMVNRDWGNIRRIVVESLNDERGTGMSYVEGKWIPGFPLNSSQIAFDCLNSDENRYFSAQGLQSYHKTATKPAWKVGDAQTDLWKDAAGATVNTNDPTTGSPAVRLLQRTRTIVDRHSVAPSTAWINALDRFFYLWTEAGMIGESTNGYVEAAWALWNPTQQGACLNLMGTSAADLALTVQNPANMTFTPNYGFQGTGDNYDANNDFVSIREDAGWLNPSWDMSVNSRGITVNDMMVTAFSLASNTANVGDVGDTTDRLYCRTRDTDAAAVQMGVDQSDRLVAGFGHKGYQPRMITGLARADNIQRIYSNGIEQNSAARVQTPAMPEAVSLLQSAGGSSTLKRHSPRPLGFACIGRAPPDDVLRKAAIAVNAFWSEVDSLS